MQPLCISTTANEALTAASNEPLSLCYPSPTCKNGKRVDANASCALTACPSCGRICPHISSAIPCLNCLVTSLKAHPCTHSQGLTRQLLGAFSQNASTLYPLAVVDWITLLVTPRFASTILQYLQASSTDLRKQTVPWIHRRGRNASHTPTVHTRIAVHNRQDNLA